MARVAVIGEEVRVSGFALAGADVLAADDPAAVTEAWARLGPEVAVVVLTVEAAEALKAAGGPRGDRLTVVMPG